VTIDRSRTVWLFIGLAALVVASAPLPGQAAQSPAARHFRIQASQYAFAPAQIRVQPGDSVTIELTSTDTVHGLYVDGYGVAVQADPGQTAALTFVADRPGSFRLRCSVTCGPLHPFMLGRLVVGSNTMFARALGLTALAAFGMLLTSRRPAPGSLST